ncbi:Ppx/GppA family phosphatase [bacterium]|nr:Ppx/GppA family phosphatase [bacterium]
MARYASIDIGTNTVLLLIAEICEGKMMTLHEEQRIIRLGKNVDANRRIGPEGFDKCSNVLAEYKSIAESMDVQHIFACGTSALRDASNREEFLTTMKQRTDIDILVISGEQEALFTFQGGCLAVPDFKGSILLIDIGGGSTEYILGNQHTIDHSVSLNIGAVRLTERFCKHDPVQPNEETALRNAARQLFDSELGRFRLSTETKFVGVAGTITTLAAMMQELERYEPSKINGYEITLESLIRLNQRLLILTNEERRQLKGLEPERADVILAGSWILEESMKLFGLSSVIVSNYGLRYGILQHFSKENINHSIRVKF